ncbi:MAG: transaldolase family protein [Chloroflexota bacterium]
MRYMVHDADASGWTGLYARSPERVNNRTGPGSAAKPINTMPQNTLEAFRDHGRLRNSLEENVDAAFAHVKALADAGIELCAVTDELQTQGVGLFSESYHKANDTVRQKRDKILAEKGAGAAARGD